MKTTPQVFVSHAHHDEDWVAKFVRELTKVGLRVWYDLAEIRVGESLADRLEEGLRGSDYLIMVTNSESVSSRWFNFELGAAIGMGKKIVAVVAKNVPAKELPGPISSKRYLVMGTPEETARDVVDAVTNTDGLAARPAPIG